MKNIIHSKWLLFHVFCLFSINANAFLIVEDFESSNWAQERGWYDINNTATSSAQSTSGNQSLYYSFNQGEQTGSPDRSMRLSLPDSDSIYLSYNRMYEDGWVWNSGGIHDFYIFADADQYQTPTNTKLTAYFEQDSGKARTVLRAAQQANSPYNDNWYAKSGSDIVFQSGVWHNIQAMVKMNDAGQSNGEMRMWVDGVLQVERTGLLLRAQGDENIMFNQLFFGPWIGSNGAIVDKAFWTDDIMVSDQAFSTEPVPTPIPPAALLFSSAIIGLFRFSKQNKS